MIRYRRRLKIFENFLYFVKEIVFLERCVNSLLLILCFFIASSNCLTDQPQKTF